MQVENTTGMVEDVTMLLTATLKPEFYDIMTTEPVMSNYIITKPDMVTAESTSSLWGKIVAEVNAKGVKDFGAAYVLGLSREMGINIFEFAKQPFFLEYLSQLKEFNMYFVEQIRNNVVSEAEFDALLQEFSQFPLWEGDEIPAQSTVEYQEYCKSYHKFYGLAEQLSRMYFGNNFNHEVIFDGVTYHIASDRVNALVNSTNAFEQAIRNLYADEPKFVWNKIITATLITTCYDDLLDAYMAASAASAKDRAECAKKPEKEQADCYKAADAAYAKARSDAFDTYCECLRAEGKNCLKVK